MDAQDEATVDQAHAHFAAEVAYWREVRGMSKKALAELMGFHPSYVSHVESGRHKPTVDFARRADETLNAGKAIWRRWNEYETARTRATPTTAAVPAPRPEQPYATGSAIVVEHDAARLDYDGRAYRLTMRRLLRNTGEAPITRYLIRISVDRYPGDPERSNAHYRAHPLTWDELALTATCRGEAMRWQTKHDRDAFKEIHGASQDPRQSPQFPTSDGLSVT
jgi:transcriptional regulator with XRE-family HTH domain